MDFSTMIEKFMPEVNGGTTEPFIIFRDNERGWQCDCAQNQYGEEFDWVQDIKQTDPFALTVTGADFACGSFPYVYDKVLVARLRAEYNADRSNKSDKLELNALMNFFEDNIGEFSSEVTDYLARFDRPLGKLAVMNPISLKDANSDVGYNEDKALEVMEIIENKIAELMNRPKDDLGNDDISADSAELNGYEELQNTRIGGRLITLSENPKAVQRYMVCEFHWNNPFGAKENVYTGVTSDFLEALTKYKKTVGYYIGCVQSERETRKILDGVELVTLTAADCLANGMNESIEGKLIIIKPEALSPEYRVSDHQLKIAIGGGGTEPDSRGNAVFCTDLYSGRKSRFERYDVLGVADISRLPQWAIVKFKEYEVQLNKESDGLVDKARKADAEQEIKKPSLLEKLDNNKKKAAAQIPKQRDEATKKHNDREV